MPSLTVTKEIGAPPDLVFATVADIENFSQAVPHIVDVEILSETRRGVGTRFRETRLMGGKEATAEMEVTEYVEGDRVRIVSDTGGTVWDSVFTVGPASPEELSRQRAAGSLSAGRLSRTRRRPRRGRFRSTASPSPCRPRPPSRRTSGARD